MSESNHAVSRRYVLGGIGAGVIGSIAGCAGLTGGSTLENQLDTIRESTTKYQDPKAALQDGFTISGPYVPGMGWHFMHPGRIKEAAKQGLSRDKPQLLTYNDHMELGAVEWAIPSKAVDESPDLFADEYADASESWHPHKAATHVFAKPDGEQTTPKQVSLEGWTTNENWAEFRPPNPDLSAGDEVALNWGSLKAMEGEKSTRVVDVAATHPDLTTLHAWVHTENPEGVFNPMNPKWGGSGHHSE